MFQPFLIDFWNPKGLSYHLFFYSAACDFWLFELIKHNLDDQDDSDSLHRAVIEFMHSLDRKEYKKTFDKWIGRMKLCVNNQGDYFEHLMK